MSPPTASLSNNNESEIDWSEYFVLNSFFMGIYFLRIAILSKSEEEQLRLLFSMQIDEGKTRKC